MDAPLPFDVAEHLTTVRVRVAHEVDLVLLLAPIGLVGAFWRVRRQWSDAPIGRS